MVVSISHKKFVMSKLNYAIDYPRSIQDPNDFWLEQSINLNWIQRPSKSLSGSIEQANITWFEDGVLNVCANCVDRHLPEKANQVAFYEEGDEPGISRQVTFAQLHDQVCRAANLLKSRGVQKGDRVCIYMPMILEAVISMLACARIGAVHSVVFGGFSAQALEDRIRDAKAVCVITANQACRGGKVICFKDNVDQAVDNCNFVQSVLVVTHGSDDWKSTSEREIDFKKACVGVSNQCEPEAMNAEDPLFILYTSGSTGTPKGVVHTQAGYLLYTMITHREVFDLKEDDVYWCTADVGWITGHSYVAYGPLANGVTQVIFEGVPNYPDCSRFWQIVDKYKVSIFYTAPTALRALMRYRNTTLANTSRESLRVLGTVGEPINPECWQWYFKSVGKERCPIQDTWWQTETGGFMLTPPCELGAQKPGCATRPFYGVEPALLDEQQDLDHMEGALCIQKPWPGMLRTVWGDHERFIETYLKPYPGVYFSGDSAHRDQDGDMWIGGRMDDVLNVSGHRLGTAEIESALVLHESVAEAAVVGFPHDVKGQGIYAYVTLMADVNESDSLRQDLIKHVRQEIGPVVTIDVIHWAADLPKTRSGKIMRRILRKIAAGDLDDFGDISTLADPGVVAFLIANAHQN